VIYAGCGANDVLYQLRLDPQTVTFTEGEPYLLTTHAENGELKHLESFSLFDLMVLTPKPNTPVYQIFQVRATIALCDFLLGNDESLQSLSETPKQRAQTSFDEHLATLVGGQNNWRDFPKEIANSAGTAVIDAMKAYADQADLGSMRTALNTLKSQSIVTIQTQIGTMQTGSVPALKFELGFMQPTF
jgi:crotonobetainyl-CoA:carnitine CoA-transferase CaiB-like acyl-CoA transferase